MVNHVDPTVSDAALDLDTDVTSMYTHMKRLTGAAAGMAQQPRKANTKRVMLSNTDDTLTQALLLAAAPFPYLSHLPLLSFVRKYVSRLDRMPVALLDRPLAFTFCQLWLALTQAIRSGTHQSTTSSASSRTSLPRFVAPDIMATTAFKLIVKLCDLVYNASLSCRLPPPPRCWI